MGYYTGDIHGSTLKIVTVCVRLQAPKEDTIVILCDVGAYSIDKHYRSLWGYGRRENQTRRIPCAEACAQRRPQAHRHRLRKRRGVHQRCGEK